MIKYFLIKTLQKIILTKDKYKKQKIYKFPIKGNENFLFIKLDRIGDACWTIKQSKILKTFFPNIKINILANTYNNWVFQKFNYLFEKIYTIDTNPPNYILKNPFGLIFDPLNTWIKNINLITKLPKNFDFIINQTNRNALFIKKLLIGKKINCITHKEIGAKYPWCGILEHFIDTKKIQNNFNIKKIEKVLLFKGGKYPHKLKNNFRKYSEELLKKYNINFEYLYDYPYKKNKLLLTNKGFIVDNLLLEEFIKNYDLIIGPDGGVMHYISLFKPTLIILTSTNIFSIDYVNQIKQIGKRKLYKSKTSQTYYLTQNLNCVGCFQLGCEKLYCHNITIKEIEGAISNIIKKSSL